jgi:hypothetical protein
VGLEPENDCAGESQEICHEDKLIGGKPPVVRTLTLTVLSRERERECVRAPARARVCEREGGN